MGEDANEGLHPEHMPVFFMSLAPQQHRRTSTYVVFTLCGVSQVDLEIIPSTLANVHRWHAIIVPLYITDLSNCGFG